MKLLDLFCGAGGAAMGYYRAGFTEIVGIDIKPQPNYPFDFIQADALCPPVNLSLFDFIHASPPCQVHSKTKHLASDQHKDLVALTREMLRATIWNPSYVIENVPGAPLINPVALNGFMFGLPLNRERWFESDVHLPFVLLPASSRRVAKMGRPVAEGEVITVVGHFSGVAYARKAMGIGWMNQKELAQAIPPAYTTWIGKRVIEAMHENS